MIKNILIRWAIIAVSVLVAAWIVPGIEVSGTGWVAVIVMAAVLGLVNAIIKPILSLLSCGCIVATLGLFILVINAFTFWLASYITTAWLNVGFTVDSLLAAFFGALIVSVVSFLLSMLLSDEDK